jgi:hypothetical protein
MRRRVFQPTQAGLNVSEAGATLRVVMRCMGLVSIFALVACDTSPETAVEKSKDAANQLASKAGDKASALVDGAGGNIEAAIAKGKQLGPEALAIGSNLRKAVDSDTSIDPIYQEVQDGGRTAAELDAAIGDMPRTEVIGGVTVGFQQIDELSEHRSLKERGYLVAWRQGDHLVGFVYRSRREIDIDKVVAEAPRLVKLVQAAAD